jgi:hypothetical protein
VSPSAPELGLTAPGSQFDSPIDDAQEVLGTVLARRDRRQRPGTTRPHSGGPRSHPRPPGHRRVEIRRAGSQREEAGAGDQAPSRHAISLAARHGWRRRSPTTRRTKCTTAALPRTGGIHPGGPFRGGSVRSRLAPQGLRSDGRVGCPAAGPRSRTQRATSGPSRYTAYHLPITRMLVNARLPYGHHCDLVLRPAVTSSRRLPSAEVISRIAPRSPGDTCAIYGYSS